MDTHLELTSSAGQHLLTSPFHGLFAGLFLLTRADEPSVANIATIPARERPIMNDLGIHHHFDAHIEEGYDLELLKLVVADLAQLGIHRRWV